MLQSVPPGFHYRVSKLRARHATRKGRCGVAISNVGDHFQSKLPGVQHVFQRAPFARVRNDTMPGHRVVSQTPLHRPLHHEPRLENFPQHLWQHPNARLRLAKHGSSGAHKRVAGIVLVVTAKRLALLVASRGICAGG